MFSDRTTKDEIELGTLFSPLFDDNGLIPVITVDADTGDVLMFAFMNAEALSLSVSTGIVHYWSRSRKKLWKKGESSGNMQEIVEMRTDCDQDVILVRVRVQASGASCHQGYRSCFYRSLAAVGQGEGTSSLVFNEKQRVFDPDEVYKD